MSSNLHDRLNEIHPRMLRAKGEADPQLLGKVAIGRAIQKALERSDITQKAAAIDMGYSDSGVIGRWINGTETPQFARLWTLGALFQQELVIALAQETAGVSIATQITVVRRTA